MRPARSGAGKHQSNDRFSDTFNAATTAAAGSKRRDRPKPANPKQKTAREKPKARKVTYLKMTWRDVGVSEQVYIYWHGEKEYFKAAITSMNTTSKTCGVQYDDGNTYAAQTHPVLFTEVPLAKLYRKMATNDAAITSNWPLADSATTSAGAGGSSSSRSTGNGSASRGQQRSGPAVKHHASSMPAVHKRNMHCTLFHCH